AQYMAGRTPNPCVRCNCMMKFGLLPAAARDMGIDFDFFATGHYARITGDFRLRQAADKARDQSYFLYRLTRQQLQKTLFPLGELAKAQVRQMAKEHGLQVADQPDSQDFYSGDYADLLDAKPSPGDIKMPDGAVVGRHDGFWRYTIGQRKGLGVSAPKPLYVVDIKPEQNQVVVDFAPPLSQGCTIVDSTGDFAAKEKLWIKVRSGATPVPGWVDSDGRATFEEPQLAVPGQSLVAYDGDMVAGGGIIEKTF
ncbi:MAG: tRNA 2-thiouridine(34) synthase MnmA, partial [Alphaproteobacteria bacterium]|nr:tRNA 2-thiouridine(34) synthase MnmA [Alphaproteobacteria bacterium]